MLIRQDQNQADVRGIWKAVAFAALASAMAFAVAVRGQETATATDAPGKPTWPERKAKVVATAAAPVNVNTATAAELQTLPRVGPAMAKRIVDGRPYADLKALDAVKGIGPKMLDALKPLVSF